MKKLLAPIVITLCTQSPTFSMDNEQTPIRSKEQQIRTQTTDDKLNLGQKVLLNVFGWPCCCCLFCMDEVITIEITATFWLGGYDLYKKLSS